MDTKASLGDNIEISQHDQDQNYVYETMTHDQKVNMYDFISNFEEAKKKKKAQQRKRKTKRNENEKISFLENVFSSMFLISDRIDII